MESLDESRNRLLDIKGRFEKEFFDPLWTNVKTEAIVHLMSSAAQEPSNVIGTGLGEKIVEGRSTGLQSIRVYVIRKIPLDEVPESLRVPPDWESVPTDVVEVGRPILRQNTFRIQPLRGGISIGNKNEPSAGTLGCVVKKNGNPLLLSNNHVLARQNQASRGEEIVQPGRFDGGTDIVATLHDFKKVDTGGITPNEIDAAVAEPLEPVSENIIRIGEPLGVAEPLPRRWVLKSGRTTDLTRGYIDDADATVEIPFSNGVGRFTDQILIRGVPGVEYLNLPTAGFIPRFSDRGDSGSAIVDEGTLHVVGLLFAGSATRDITWANKISNVESTLDVTLR